MAAGGSLGGPTAATVARATPAVHPIRALTLPDIADQVFVDEDLLLAGVGVEQVEHPPPDHHVLPQRYRARFVDHHGGVAPDGLHPRAEFLGVADRRGQADQPHIGRQVQDDLFPHRAAEAVREIVHLVHHYEGQPAQGIRGGIEHVAQHLGGHHHHRRIRIDRLVSGEQTHLIAAVPLGEIGELLVGQRLDRRGVEALSTRSERQVHREFTDDGFARTGRRTYQHAVPTLEGRTGVALKWIQSETQLGGKLCQLAYLRPVI